MRVLAVIAVAALTTGAIFAVESDIAQTLEFALPPGQQAYLWTKYLAQWGFVLLTVQLAVGLAIGRQARGWERHHHQWLGLTVVIVIGGHVAAYLIAAGERAGATPWELLVPTPGRGWYSNAVALGAAALLLVLATALTGILRARGGHLAALLHPLAWLAWGLATAHSIMIGTETRGASLWTWIYGASLLAIGALLVIRFAQMGRGRSG